MGFPALALFFSLIVCSVYALLSNFVFPDDGEATLSRTLQITIPEDLEYSGLFDDIFAQYTTEARLVRVKTTNLGALNRLSYDVQLRRIGLEKEMIDQLRCRNGNLEINLAAREACSAL